MCARLFATPAAGAGAAHRLASDSPRIKAHGAAGSGRKKGDTDRALGNSRGGRNRKAHAVTDPGGRPVVLVLTAGRVSDFVPAPEGLAAAPPAAAVIADRGYDSDAWREFIKKRGANPVIPPKNNRKVQYRYDKSLYKTRRRVARFFCRLKDLRRGAARYDRPPYIFMAAVFLASMVAFWL